MKFFRFKEIGDEKEAAEMVDIRLKSKENIEDFEEGNNLQECSSRAAQIIFISLCCEFICIALPTLLLIKYRDSLSDLEQAGVSLSGVLPALCCFLQAFYWAYHHYQTNNEHIEKIATHNPLKKEVPNENTALIP